jgi:hypothetical protein
MKKIAVILCSKSKQDYECSVREMYCSSVLFRAREYFMDLCYDEWYVNTSKYGFMSPDKVIEPYDSWYITKTSSNSQLKNNPNILTRDMINTWLDKVRQQFPNPEEIELHCHISGNYVKELSKVFPNIVYIKPQVSFTSTAWKYVDACKMYLNGATLAECNAFISEKAIATRPKETKKWFYHLDGREFYGNAYDITKLYTELDNGCMYGLSMGTTQMSHGWVVNNALLASIKHYPLSNTYRLEKGLSRINRQGQRMDINSAFDELEFDIERYT